jgi:hypothetical protein
VTYPSGFGLVSVARLLCRASRCDWGVEREWLTGRRHLALRGKERIVRHKNVTSETVLRKVPDYSTDAVSNSALACLRSTVSGIRLGKAGYSILVASIDIDAIKKL